ncbi:hypothetical protein G352_24326 [Rhodococcus ruber BKS 20-38]|uniref:Uncharacterized protein n=1 Tax=Rhodococcus ruber BKS 20-38 TaxID=1278076 RepID=M2YY39_9NOCA|nr:DUF3562 domain-containing protein [Rhodococcus ruber]EME53269.1 hypothetical protein G352_24326 [Rhodococcus ruber BKS 20-38]
MDNSTEEQAIARAVHSLQGKFPDIPVDEVDSLVAEVRARYDGCRIRDFVPLFVERHAREKLHERTGGSVFQD